jgi:hypothetical protein
MEDFELELHEDIISKNIWPLATSMKYEPIEEVGPNDATTND